MRRRSIGVLFGTMVVIVVLSLLAARSRPVVYALTESGDPVREPIWSLFNPFRDRAPERVAEAVLSDLERSEYAEALSQIDAPGATRSEIAEREKEYHLRSWKLLNRRDDGATTRLFYRTARGNASSFDSPLWVSVQRRRDGWKVTRFEAWY